MRTRKLATGLGRLTPCSLLSNAGVMQPQITAIGIKSDAVQEVHGLGTGVRGEVREQDLGRGGIFVLWQGGRTSQGGAGLEGRGGAREG